MQHYIVYIIICVTALLVVRYFYRKMTGRGGGCNCDGKDSSCSPDSCGKACEGCPFRELQKKS